MTSLLNLYPSLYYGGIVHLGLFLLFVLLSQVDHRRLKGINVWVKPMKFALSIGIYLLTWPFMLQYLPFEPSRSAFITCTVISLSFEMVCIAGQAARGQLSHFNTTSVYNTVIFAAMGIAHFIGIHALQVIPLFGWLSGSASAAPTLIFTVCYTALASICLIRALNGRPLR